MLIRKNDFLRLVLRQQALYFEVPARCPCKIMSHLAKVTKLLIFYLLVLGRQDFDF